MQTAMRLASHHNYMPNFVLLGGPWPGPSICRWRWHSTSVNCRIWASFFKLHIRGNVVDMLCHIIFGEEMQAVESVSDRRTLFARSRLCRLNLQYVSMKHAVPDVPVANDNAVSSLNGRMRMVIYKSERACGLVPGSDLQGTIASGKDTRGHSHHQLCHRCLRRMFLS